MSEIIGDALLTSGMDRKIRARAEPGVKARV
jgi:hypothetical protein